MDINNNTKTNFGWRWPEHKTISRNSLKKVPAMCKSFGNMIEASILPDFDETYILYQKHFYFPNTNKSYLDIKGKSNARAMYYKHVQEMIKHRNTDRDTAIEHAGRAVHYLQDICQPQHISQGGIIKKTLERTAHKDFEKLACNQRNTLVNNANNSDIKISARSFSDLFKQTIAISKNIEVPKHNNKNNWINIAQQGYDTAVCATDKFIELVNHVFS